MGGLKAYNIAKKAEKAKILAPVMSSTVRIVVNTVMGTFKGLLKGFSLNYGAGRISDAITSVGKYVDFDARFDRTTPGKAIDNKITNIENYVIRLIGGK
ncbi:hypothetical protein JOC73_003069 [Alkaliphilus hydrothermalis]|uniref:Uncharacterized protein n=2 Tax=Alkaliphilus hydrothermalis TaxID=1482730 RepID=A0ABS2NU40_9FIRM|nr:hypothetical protein [Alkaliphilus hydrothermalis]